MAEALTLARPYARAAFEVARDENALARWSDALSFATAVASDPAVAQLRNDPRVQPNVLVDLHLPAGTPADGKFGHLLAQMASHGRLSLLPEVATLFEQFKRDAEAVLEVRVTSAQALDDAEVEGLKAALQRRYQRTIELQVDVDASLLGGAIIDAGGEVIDGSARGRLAQLASTLAN